MFAPILNDIIKDSLDCIWSRNDQGENSVHKKTQTHIEQTCKFCGIAYYKLIYHSLFITALLLALVI